MDEFNASQTAANSSDAGLVVLGPSILLRTVVLPVMLKIPIQGSMGVLSAEATRLSADIGWFTVISPTNNSIIADRTIVYSNLWIKHSKTNKLE